MTPPPPDEMEERPRLSLGRRLLFLSVLLLFGLVLAEVALRVALPDTEIRQELDEGGLIQPYRPGAGADLVAAEFRVRYQINDLGYRGRPSRDLSKLSAAPKVLLLGDSFTEGYGVALDDTYGQVAERALPGCEVWSAAAMGSSPMFYVLRARELAPALKPAVVVVQLFDNDLNENRYRKAPFEASGRLGPLPDDLRPGSDWGTRDWAIVEGVKRLSRRLRGKPLPRIFVRVGASVPASSLVPPKGEASPFAGFFRAEPDPAWSERLDQQALLLRQLIEEARGLEGAPKLLVLYVPHPLIFEAGREASELRSINPHAQRVAALCEELGVAMLDATEVLSASERNPREFYYEKDLHWTPEGHELIGQALAKVLQPWLAGS